jgi:proteasome accessory factor B
LTLLKQLGFPLQETAGEHGRKTWRVDSKWSHGALPFTLDEALALHLGRRALDPLAGTPIWSAAQRAHQKLQAMFSSGAVKHLDRLSAAILRTNQGSSDYAGHGRILDELLKGIEQHRSTFVTYQSERATEPVTYDIYPYGVVFHRGSLYVVGFAPRRESLRHWKVNRILDAEATDVIFQRPADFDLAEHLKDHGEGQVEVRVRFAATVARYVQESQWHSSQQLHVQPDRSVLATFRLSGTQEIKSWLLSFGPQAEVLAPAELREEVKKDLEAALAHYDRPSAARPAVRRLKTLNPKR